MRTFIATLLAIALAACSPTSHHIDAPASSAPAATATAHSAAPAASTPTPAASAPTAAADKPAPVAASMPSDTAAFAGTVLTRYHWQLATAIDARGRTIDALFARTGKPLKVDFAGRDIEVGNACNRMRARYTAAAGKLVIGHFATTLVARSDRALAALDRAVGAYLTGTLAYATDASEANPQLILTTQHSDKLVFNGVPTAATRYGSEGETVFLEIAPQTVPCNHPSMPHVQCLDVRTLQYDARGLRTGTPGPWHPLAEPIEGYTHHPGQRNVLRVKRYAIAHPPAGASSVAYVLDRVVESHASAH